MKILRANVMLFLVSCCLTGCAVDVVPTAPEVEATEAALTVDGCSTPRPPVRGCRYVCKPCLIPECVDGQWVYERVDWADGECDPIPGPGSSCCKVPLSGGCPAQCQCCDYQ